MPRPVPTPILHLTHVRHLPRIIEHGLIGDLAARERGLLEIEIGEPSIKAPRRTRQVGRPPGGVVADYAPFYFAPRSPMLFSIDKGNVSTYQGGCEPLVYLVTSLERLTGAGLTWLVTDRNARLDYATFRGQDEDLDDHVDWDLMRETMWNNTPDFPDRKERRMAECLVREPVPWDLVTGVAARSEAVAQRVKTVLDEAGATTPVSVRRAWYF